MTVQYLKSVKIKQNSEKKVFVLTPKTQIKTNTFFTYDNPLSYGTKRDGLRGSSQLKLKAGHVFRFPATFHDMIIIDTQMRHSPFPSEPP